MWPDPRETQEILTGARAGNSDDVGALLERHTDALKRLVRMRLDPALRKRVDPSDVVQDVLLEASRRLDDYLKHPDLPFHLWLRRIALDHVIGAWRRHREARRRSVDREDTLGVNTDDREAQELAARLIDGKLTPAATSLRRELASRFETAMLQLGETDREILVLRHFERLSNIDASRLLGLTEPAAAMRYIRALRKLRGILGEE